jgi:hypothetical protein
MLNMGAALFRPSLCGGSESFLRSPGDASTCGAINGVIFGIVLGGLAAAGYKQSKDAKTSNATSTLYVSGIIWLGIIVLSGAVFAAFANSSSLGSKADLVRLEEAGLSPEAAAKQLSRNLALESQHSSEGTAPMLAGILGGLIARKGNS